MPFKRAEALYIYPVVGKAHMPGFVVYVSAQVGKILLIRLFDGRDDNLLPAVRRRPRHGGRRIGHHIHGDAVIGGDSLCHQRH